jgi:hypothetical protein
LAVRIPSVGCGGEEFNKISRLRCGLRPRRRRSGKEKTFKFFLALTQCGLIGLDLMETPAIFGGLLSGHPAPRVEVDRIVRHGLSP